MKLSAKDKRDYDAHLESKSLHAQYINKVKAESLAQGKAEGVAKGRAETEKEKAELKKRIAIGLLSYGLDLYAISDVAGIDLSELEKQEESEV